MPKTVLLLFTILVIVSLFGVFVIYFQNMNQQSNAIEKSLSSGVPNFAPQVTPAPTPMPFEDLTIQYLRKKEYKSQLSNLEQVVNNGNYISYLTSYDSDNLKINGLLTKPSGDMPSGGWPAIVFVHGYIPPSQYRTLEKYVDYVNTLARSGFVVFKIDLRGHGDSEGEAGGGYYSSDYIVDVLNARAALQTADFVNKEKIGFWGHSMAGNVLMRAFAAKPDIPAVVIWAGAGYTYLDLNEYGIDDNSYQPLPTNSERQRRRQLLRQTYGDPKDGNPFWKLVAPTNYLNDLQGAVQINHAVDDDVVSIEYSRNLKNLLSNTKVPHELHEYPSGGHNINGASFTLAMQNTVNFFKKYLGN